RPSSSTWASLRAPSTTFSSPARASPSTSISRRERASRSRSRRASERVAARLDDVLGDLAAEGEGVDPVEAVVVVDVADLAPPLLVLRHPHQHLAEHVEHLLVRARHEQLGHVEGDLTLRLALGGDELQRA